MSVSIAPYPRFKAFYPGTGNPLAGGKLWTLQPGTTGFGYLKATYADSIGLVVNTNPVILDPSGEAEVWLSGYTKMVLQDAAGNPVWTADYVSSSGAAGAGSGQWMSQAGILLTYVNGAQFSTPGDQTGLFQTGMRIQAIVSAGTIYGTITASASFGSPVATTVTVSWDSGALDRGLSAVATSILTPLHGGMPAPPVYISNYASLTAAVTAIGAAPMDLLINAPTTVTAATTVPANIGISVAEGGLVTNAGGTLAVNGPFSASGQAFSGFAPGQVTGLKWARPEWFGDVTASGAPVNCAIYAVDNAATGPGQVIFSQGTYDIDGGNPIVASIDGRGANLIGAGEYATKLSIQVGASRDGITYTNPTAYGRGGVIRDMSLVSPATSSSRDLLFVYNWEGLEIRNVNLDTCGRDALHLTSVENMRIRSSHIRNAAVSNLAIDDDGVTIATTVRMFDSYLTTAIQVGADIKCTGYFSEGNVYESNGFGIGAEGVRFRSGSGVFSGDWFEDNAGHDMSVGYDASQPAWGTSVSVVNPFLQAAGGHKASGKGGFYVKNGRFSLTGPGTWLNMQNTIIVDTGASSTEPGPVVRITGTGPALSPEPIFSWGNKLWDATYLPTVLMNAGVSDRFRITVTDGNAFTINHPFNATPGQKITMTIRNTSGGALGTVTWDTGYYKMAAWTSPSTGYSRSISFVYDGVNWFETERSASDIPN